MKKYFRSPLSLAKGLQVEVERVIDYISNNVCYSIYYKDAPYRYIVLDSTLAKKLASYDLIRKDLDSSYSSIKCLIELIHKTSQSGEEINGWGGHDNSNYIIMKSLHQAAIITYAKCFSNSSGGKKKKRSAKRGVKLESSLIDNFPRHIRETHTLLMEQRNEYIAHGGATDLEQSFSIVIPPPNEEFNFNVITLEIHSGEMTLEHYNNVLLLINTLQEELKIMQKKKTDALIQNELLKMTEEDIAKRSVINHVVKFEK